MQTVKINPELVPAADMRVLCQTVIDAALQFFADPEHQRQFEKWQTDQKKKEEKVNV